MLYAVTPSQNPRLTRLPAEKPPRQRHGDRAADSEQPWQRRTAPLGEDRTFDRRFHPRLGGRVAAAVADQRLVGDFGPTVFADHRGGIGNVPERTPGSRLTLS